MQLKNQESKTSLLYPTSQWDITAKTIKKLLGVSIDKMEIYSPYDTRQVRPYYNAVIEKDMKKLEQDSRFDGHKLILVATVNVCEDIFPHVCEFVHEIKQRHVVTKISSDDGVYKLLNIITFDKDGVYRSHPLGWLGYHYAEYRIPGMHPDELWEIEHRKHKHELEVRNHPERCVKPLTERDLLIFDRQTDIYWMEHILEGYQKHTR